jgi:hypothetical protein
MAVRISALAAEAGMEPDWQGTMQAEIAIDATDPPRCSPSGAPCGLLDEPPRRLGEPVVAIVDPRRLGPPVWFQAMDGPGPQRNRIHIDVSVPHRWSEKGWRRPWRPEDAWSATGSPAPSGCRPIRKATKSASGPGRIEADAVWFGLGRPSWWW